MEYMRKKIKDATIEEMIADLTNWEDPDTVMQVCATETGGVHIGAFDDWRGWVAEPTFREALIAYGKKYHEEGIYYDEDYPKIDWKA
jgi:hypothetical protein